MFKNIIIKLTTPIIVIIFFSLNVLSENNLKVRDPGQHQITNTPADSIITTLLLEINPDTIEYFMQSLEDFGTRYALAPNRFEVADWIKSKFIGFGFSDVVIDSFESHTRFPIDTTTLQMNVVATIPGSERPDDIYIIGAHYDSWVTIGDPMLFAPGADDNASGSSSILEIARVMKKMNFQPEATIKFIAFATEESGTESGSENYAKKAYDTGMNIEFMLNNDAISYTTQSIENRGVNIWGIPEFIEYKEYSSLITSNYIALTPIIMPTNYGSDGYSFSRLGIPAISFSEAEHNPKMHSEEDIVSNCNIEYCTEIIKLSCATLISIIGMPSKVENFDIVDMGDGKSLLLNWSPPSDQDFEGYHLYLGTESGIYDTTLISPDTSMIINNLMEGVEYFIGITTYDLDGYESFLIEETGTPLSLPLSPSGFTESPLWHKVELNWLPNLEYDLLGYNIYRSTNVDELGNKLNVEVVTDTIFTDEAPENGIYYYYTVKAVDSMQNESINNTPIKSRSVSLDQGIVLVDETTDGNGSILNPTDEEVDDFYNAILERFERQNFDIIEEGGVSLADLGAFSTVIWHGSDYRDLTVPFDRLDDIKRYLDYGGNFIYTGFLPSEAFAGNILYPADFNAGDFMYDYLKISHVEKNFASRFVGAIPVFMGYDEVYADSAKIPPTTNYHLPFIEGIFAGPGGTEIYLYDTYFDTSTAQGSMKNEPVGVEYIGDDYKVITLSFPLYYMNIDQAKALIEHIMIEKFNEVVAIEDLKQETTPTKFVLYQNYPNPFNPTTMITYQVPTISDVDISIYNILGQKVVTLVSEKKQTGYHMVEWDASGFASGVYYYKLRCDQGFVQTKKLILLR